MENIKLDIITIIGIVGITQGFFLLSALFKTEQGERLINRMFFCLILVFTLEIFLTTIFSIVISISGQLLMEIRKCVSFLYGPLFLFYTKAINSHSFSFKGKEIKHFIPFITLLSFIILLSILNPKTILTKCAQIIHIDLKDFLNIMRVFLSVTLFIHLNIYLLYSYRKITTAKENTINKNVFLTHRIFLVLYFLYNIIGFTSDLTGTFISNLSYLSRISTLFITFIIFLFEYTTILKPELLFIIWEKESHNSVYKKINVSKEKIKEYMKRLYSVMEQEKLYKDQDLTLSLLADRVYLSRNLLSYLLNNVIGTNFYDFVNGFRVEAVKALLANDSAENENILNIAFNAGFNSKSAFNKIFKKHTNMSPSEYRKEMINEKKEHQVLSRMMKFNLLEELENSYNIKSVARTS